MASGWKYRASSAVGISILTVIVVAVANHHLLQEFVTTHVPLFNRLSPVVLDGSDLYVAMLITVTAVVVALFPVFKPKPRRILDVVFLTQERIIVAGLTLATLGYFNWSHRMPRVTLVVTMGILVIIGPIWFVWLRQQPTNDPEKTLLIGDDIDQLKQITHDTSQDFVGYLAPSSIYGGKTPSPNTTAEGIVADGGLSNGNIRRLGGLSRLEETIIDYEIDTVVLAFKQPDRAEFFGALDTCDKYGVRAKVHRDYTDSVLTSPETVGPLVDVELEPWDIQDYALKRLFDIAFASVGLIVLTPLFAIIALAIKLDSRGPVFFSQKRTSRFGGEFSFYKFRTMVENAEELTGVVVSAEDAGERDPRVTRVGRVLRKTHLDEAPQLWSVLKGDMRVVGPRPAQSELEHDFTNETNDWAKRWFVKPGLTGLAQINDATGHEPEKKLHYDLQYIKNQSLTYDMKIIARQFWKVGTDVSNLIRK